MVCKNVNEHEVIQYFGSQRYGKLKSNLDILIKI